jgi:hypothetical protein
MHFAAEFSRNGNLPALCDPSFHMTFLSCKTALGNYFIVFCDYPVRCRPHGDNAGHSRKRVLAWPPPLAACTQWRGCH